MNSPGTCSCMKPRESPWPLSSSTSRAPGCQVRTMILSPCWWGPRNAKGSPCSARISACTWAASIRSSTALPLSIVILHEGFAQLYQPSQGHIQPLWPVAGFVRNLVGGLLDTEQRQRCLFSIVLLPDMVQTGCGLPVGFEKRLHRLFPVSFTDDRPGLLSRLRLLGAMEAAQGCGCRIIEGAQQSADVLVRTVALTPLLQWPRWLALEVDEADITGQHQHLSQMQVSMNADTDGTFDVLCQTLHLVAQSLTMLQQPADLLPRQLGQVADMLGQGIQRRLQLGVDVLTAGSTVIRARTQETEVLPSLGVGQQLVHLPQTLPENGGKGLQFGQSGELVFLFGEATHQLVPHRPFQGVPGPLPGITTAGNVPLQNHQGVLLAIGGSASHFAEQRRYGGELPPGQETAHFGFRVHTRHDLADDLEHHALADQHRGIGLLDGQSLDLFLRQILRVEVWGWQEGNLLRAGTQHLPLAQGGQHLPGESGEGCRVGQQPQPRAPTQSRHGEGSRCLAGVL